jgi:hypothetical protein
VGAGLDGEASDLRQRLLRCDDELGRTETALDYTLELLRPGSDRKAKRRTRAACLMIASARMQAVKTAIVERLGESYEDSIRVAKPRFRDPAHEAGGRVTVALAERPDDRSFWQRWFGWLGFGSD